MDELLCFGWIDGIRRKLDDIRTMQLISPGIVEHWAKSYKDRAAKLIKEGEMKETGYNSIETSKQSSLWDFMDNVDKMIVPKDLLEALQMYQVTEHFFHSINNSSKRFVLRWIKLAKTEKTRAFRVAKITVLSSRGEKLEGS